ncbi:MAG: glycoside hydrolase family 31 protein [Peptostreptococcaceae bacterium]
MKDYKKFIFEIKQDEYWYGPIVNDGVKYPIGKGDSYSINLDQHYSPNQVNPLLISTKGRYIWCDSGFKLSVSNDRIEILSYKKEPKLYECGTTLKEAYLDACNKFFKPNGIVPPKAFFTKPQYNTWIELIYNQTQEGILNYARDIVKNNMPIGIIMIDDGWSDYYGKWDFNVGKFKNPKAMVDELHELGFKVMLWTCPFITPDTLEYRMLKDKKLLVMDKDGEPSIKRWWNGCSAVLDITNPEAIDWYNKQNQNIMDSYGVDGFKFDAGDAQFYSEEDVTYRKVDPNEHSELWAKLGCEYEYNEYRAAFKTAGLNLVQRLADKSHSWENNGVASLIPNQLTQGILGYAYTCPDMIGGGEYMSFLENSDKLDEELFVRYAQCAALMPMMQFSAAPWRVLGKDNFENCKKAANLHIEYADYIYELAKNTSLTGEPIVRFMEYEFPNQGLEKVTEQFMLGDKYLIAPVTKKGEEYKEVHIPKGIWRDIDKNEITGPKKIQVKTSLDKLDIYIKID